jgi:hypothetical protein
MWRPTVAVRNETFDSGMLACSVPGGELISMVADSMSAPCEKRDSPTGVGSLGLCGTKN